MRDKVKKAFDYKRLASAAAALPLLILFLKNLPPDPYFLILLLAVGMLALREFHVMYKVPLFLSIPSVLLGACLLYVMCFYPFYISEAIFAAFFILLMLRLLIPPSPGGALKDIGVIATGYLYIIGFLVFQWFLRRDASGLENIFMLYASVWIADASAYYIGTYAGTHKLCPSISPNKTYEGFAGSIIGGAAGALLVSFIYGFQVLPAGKSVMAGVVIGTVTVSGDLIESMFKRDAGVKDSGNLLPGHGGLLDKIDGLLVSGPVLYILLRFI
ncbi:MAG: phosphatidate cytidylyltransferase [Nitrospirae bacterium]|nr:phosphatidate cytidylyltransferase [Nitrospirota bacterium]